MKINTAMIAGELDRFEVQLADRGFVLAIAVARAVAYSLPVPSGPVDNAQTFFTHTHLGDAEQMLSEVNEQVVLNIDTVTDLISRIWLFRYRLVYDCQNKAVKSFLDALIRTGTRELSPQVSEVLTRYCQNENNDILDTITSAVMKAITGVCQPPTSTVSTEDDSATGDDTSDADADKDKDTTATAPDDSIDERAVAAARKFHEIYERLAPDFGYETREETREFDPESQNGKLMTAVLKELLDTKKPEAT